MSTLIDLEQLNRVFTRRGERVVVPVPGAEPVVLVPLSEYERLMSARPQSSRATPPAAKAKPAAKAPALPAAEPEPIDPPQGGLADDDQYFPEPL